MPLLLSTVIYYFSCAFIHSVTCSYNFHDCWRIKSVYPSVLQVSMYCTDASGLLHSSADTNQSKLCWTIVFEKILSWWYDSQKWFSLTLVSIPSFVSHTFHLDQLSCQLLKDSLGGHFSFSYSSNHTSSVATEYWWSKRRTHQRTVIFRFTLLCLASRRSIR